MVQGCSESFRMGYITTFQFLQNENPSKIDEIRPNRPKKDHFCQIETPHLRKKTADNAGIARQGVGAVISTKTRLIVRLIDR